MSMHTITVEEMHEWTRENRAYQLLDVREPDEREEDNIGGCHIPLGQLAENTRGLTPDLPVIVYCRSGGRSQKACAILSEKGFEAYNLTGGITAYRAQG
jgi:rhodanese-related sulfurtransferase